MVGTSNQSVPEMAVEYKLMDACLTKIRWETHLDMADFPWDSRYV